MAGLIPAISLMAGMRPGEKEAAWHAPPGFPGRSCRCGAGAAMVPARLSGLNGAARRDGVRGRATGCGRRWPRRLLADHRASRAGSPTGLPASGRHQRAGPGACCGSGRRWPAAV